MSEFKRQGQWGCFLFRDFSHFFTASEVMDYYLGRGNGLSLQHALSLLQQGQYSLNPLLAIFAFLFHTPKDATKKQPLSFHLNTTNMRELINNDGAKLLLCGIDRVLTRLSEKQGGSLQNEMALKVLLNTIYVTVDFLQLNSTHPHSSKELNQLYLDAKTDDSLMRMVTLSLEAHYVPIKKLTMLYAKVLANLFHHGTPPSPRIHPHFLFSEQDIASLPNDNLLRYGELERYKITNPPPSGPVAVGSSNRVSPVEQFYRRHNSGECPLAQSIVVGLLRSLLTVCNCQTHKRFQTVRGSGVDSFREWQLSYRFMLERPQLQSGLPVQAIAHLKAYESFDLLSSQGRQPKPEQQAIWGQFYSHKIYTTAAIAGFFQLLLVALHENMFLQYSYFLQLISDANGILVFLKFLTDKFSGLEAVRAGSPFTRGGQGQSLQFRQEVMLTVYSVLLMLYTSCNNYTEKVRSYLFDYNSYLIIKKIPSLFLAREDEGAGMPSREELDRLPSSLSSRTTIRRLTELCYDLLKIQIPLFSKKIKENSANMRVIIDIYCKYPQRRQARTLSKLDKLLLKSKGNKTQKFIMSVEEMKAVHNEYNNLYYWSNDFINQQSTHPKPLTPSLPPLAQLESLIDAEAWLQQNLWKYYD